MPEQEWLEISARLGLAIVIGAVIGINRDLHDKPAGLRTHALVALGAAMLLMLFGRMIAGVDTDLAATSRVAQGIITGVGFLGAGVILHGARAHRVHGLTTAAAIWTTAVFGMVCGSGRFALALIAFALVLLILVLGGPLERLIHRRLRAPKPQPAPMSLDED